MWMKERRRRRALARRYEGRPRRVPWRIRSNGACRQDVRIADHSRDPSPSCPDLQSAAVSKHRSSFQGHMSEPRLIQTPDCQPCPLACGRRVSQPQPVCARFKAFVITVVRRQLTCTLCWERRNTSRLSSGPPSPNCCFLVPSARQQTPRG